METILTDSARRRASYRAAIYGASREEPLERVVLRLRESVSFLDDLDVQAEVSAYADVLDDRIRLLKDSLR